MERKLEEMARENTQKDKLISELQKQADQKDIIISELQSRNSIIFNTTSSLHQTPDIPEQKTYKVTVNRVRC